MSRTVFPPTPAPSTDITGKSVQPCSLADTSFALPPAAIASNSSSSSVSASSVSANSSDSSYRPISPSLPATSGRKPVASTPRKRSYAVALIEKDDYALPPPPTRSRKIIQMQPKTGGGHTGATTNESAGPASSKAATTTPFAGGRKKQVNGTTVTGKKIARKTAHSLIERRRRSKMNEEFGVLKDMIPACAGQEMHKLAILQASIEYMRYLQQCVADLKAAHKPRRTSRISSSNPSQLTSNPPRPSPSDTMSDDEGDSEDPAFETSSPFLLPHTQPHQQLPPFRPLSRPTCPATSTTVSPAIHPTDATPTPHPSYTFSPQSSPASGAQVQHPSCSLASPALLPRPDERMRDRDKEDHEATAALLMLTTDRRSWGGSAGGTARGMSVRDLLSQ